MSKPLVKSLSAENETLKNKVSILIAEAENDKMRMVALEKSLQVEKDFCKLKDKQIGDLELKLENIGAMVIQDSKILTSTLMNYASTTWRALIFL